MMANQDGIFAALLFRGRSLVVIESNTHSV